MSDPPVRSTPTLPTGTLTFLFTDIEGSTRLWEQYPEAMQRAHARHSEIILDCVERCNGTLVRTRGEGDSTFSVFTGPAQGVAAACAFQCALHQEPWPRETPLRVRAALHTGLAHLWWGDYNSADVNRCARMRSLACGGQTLLSQATCDLVQDHLPEGARLKPLGSHRLKDLRQPEPLYQLLHPDLPADFPPLRSLDTLPTNLPQQLTSFIGREKEIEEVKRLIATTTRLLTLTGTGGCGKTRLALQAAAEMLDLYPDGVWLVELAPLSDPTLVPQTVAFALGLKEEPGRTLQETLIHFLLSRKLLILLDNCEHLVEACARMVETLLRACPQLRICATSREPLGVAGEQVWRVPSLALPDASFRSLEAMIQYETVRLFVERASCAQTSFTLTERNAPAIAQICVRLDGIPLALELAAARVKALSVEQIASRLDDRFRLLTGGTRTALPRQQTLRALIDWSYDLLTEPEQRLLRHLSVFAGGWTLEAAERICSDEAMQEGAVLDLLASLVEKSLVLFEKGEPENGRYRLLETIRQYSRERLAEMGDAKPLGERHRTFFLALAEEADSQLEGPEQVGWLERLETEHDNLRAALESGQANEGLRLAVAMGRFWRLRGYLNEGWEYLANVLSRTETQERTRMRARALSAAGILVHSQGDFALARTLFEQSLAISRELEDKQDIANSLNSLGTVAYDQGDYSAVRALFEQSLAISRELGDERGIATSLNNLGNLAYEQADYALARSLHEESLTIARKLGDRRRIAYSLCNLGNVAYDQGDFALSRSMHEKGLVIRTELGDKMNIAVSLSNLGNVVKAQGDFALARTLFEQSLAIRRVLGDKRGIAYLLEGFACLAAAQAQLERAGQLWGAAEALRGVIGLMLPSKEREEHDELEKAARAALGVEAFAAAWAEGYAMTLQEAVAEALQGMVQDV